MAAAAARNYYFCARASVRAKYSVTPRVRFVARLWLAEGERPLPARASVLAVYMYTHTQERERERNAFDSVTRYFYGIFFFISL